MTSIVYLWIGFILCFWSLYFITFENKKEHDNEPENEVELKPENVSYNTELRKKWMELARSKRRKGSTLSLYKSKRRKRNEISNRLSFAEFKRRAKQLDLETKRLLQIKLNDEISTDEYVHSSDNDHDDSKSTIGYEDDLVTDDLKDLDTAMNEELPYDEETSKELNEQRENILNSLKSISVFKSSNKSVEEMDESFHGDEIPLAENVQYMESKRNELMNSLKKYCSINYESAKEKQLITSGEEHGNKYEEMDQSFHGDDIPLAENVQYMESKRNELMNSLKKYCAINTESPKGTNWNTNEVVSGVHEASRERISNTFDDVNTYNEKKRSHIVANLNTYLGVHKKLKVDNYDESDVPPEKDFSMDKDAYDADSESSMEEETPIIEIEYHGSIEDSPSDVSKISDDDEKEDCSVSSLPEHLQNAFKIMSSNEVLVPLIKKLDTVNVLDDFILMMRLIAEGTLDPDNLPLLLATERAKFQNCSSTTQMKYRKETLEFWMVVLRQCHRSGLLLFSGLKHGGQVASFEAEKSRYDPCKASVNFAVPHPCTLLKHEQSVPRSIKPGLMNEGFPLVDKQKQHILIYDGKRLAKGLDGEDSGDINLWGLEGPPNISESIQRLKDECAFVEHLQTVETQMTPETLNYLPKILKALTMRIKDIRYKELRHKMGKKKLRKMMNSHPSAAKRYKFAMSAVKASIYLSRQWIQRALNLNYDICKLLSKLNRSDALFFDAKHMDCRNQPNIRNLFPTDYLQDKVNLQDHPEIVKQRSDQWYALRKQSRITGSSSFNALGMARFKDQVNHYREFILKNYTPTFTAEQKDMMEHGKDNEINAICTLGGILMPALLPSCARYIEDGANFLDGSNVQKLAEISSDGIIRCLNHNDNSDCPGKMPTDHSDIVVEVKCPYPNDSIVIHHYKPSLRYATQLLLEMKVKNVTKAWYVCYTQESTVLIQVLFDDSVWTEVWNLICDFYDSKVPRKPFKRDPRSEQLKNVLKTYIDQKCTVIAEVPSITGIEGEFDGYQISTPYRPCIPAHRKPYSKLDVVNTMSSLSEGLITSLEEAHDLSREQCSEIFAFILTDTDRIKSKNAIPHVPIAYALKGTSLPCQTARKLIDQVRKKCSEENVRILCEVSDAQWANIAFRDTSNEPLTLLQFQKKCWHYAMRNRKLDLIEYLESFCKIHEHSLENLSIQRHFQSLNSSIYSGNIKVSCRGKRFRNGKIKRKIYIESMGGSEGSEGLMRDMISLWKRENPAVWNVADRIRTQRPTYMEITAEELINYLPEEVIINDEQIIRDIINDSEALHLSQSGINQDDVDNDNVSLLSDGGSETSVESRSNKDMLHDMLRSLIDCGNKDIWKLITPKMLYTSYLQKATTIAECFTVKELDAMNEIVKIHTGQSIFKVSENKQSKVNKVSATFGDKTQWTSTRKAVYNPCSLRMLSMAIVKKEIPKKVISVAAAQVKFQNELADWESISPIPLEVFIEHRNANFKLFSYPEFCETLQEIQPRTIDPTHIFTNLRAHVCRSGFENVSKYAFRRVSRTHPKILPRPIVVDILDQQNTDFAKLVFSEKVEYVMRLNGDDKEADFVQLIRHWYQACDGRGIDVNTRIDYLIELHDYLTKGVDFGKFPPNMTHIKRIPIITYESLLQSISTRIYLYSLSDGKKYNQRAISSLAVESFFADLSRAEFTSTGCPKATKIDKLVSVVMELNSHKHNPDKKFKMDSRKGTPYPVHEMENEADILSGQFGSHMFDKDCSSKKKRVKLRPTVSHPLKTQRGTRSVRSDFYKLNESKLTAMNKLNLSDDDSF